MEHHGYACIDKTLVNSTSLFPGEARREEIELTLVSYFKLQTFHAISVKGIYRSWFQVSLQVNQKLEALTLTLISGTVHHLRFGVRPFWLLFSFTHLKIVKFG